jgi:hypothetical protein
VAADCVVAQEQYKTARRHTDAVKDAPTWWIGGDIAKVFRVERALRQEHGPIQNVLAACKEGTRRWNSTP